MTTDIIKHEWGFVNCLERFFPLFLPWNRFAVAEKALVIRYIVKRFSL